MIKHYKVYSTEAKRHYEVAISVHGGWHSGVVASFDVETFLNENSVVFIDSSVLKEINKLVDEINAEIMI